MKVFILSDLNSVHTKRWVSSLAENGLQIFVFGLQECNDDYYYASFSNVETFGFFKKYENSMFSKLKYLSAISSVKEKLKAFQPDILHAHYASSYGLLGAMADFHPYIISVWGSDVYSFPKKSFLHQSIVQNNFKKADKVLSTSQIMANEAAKYTDKPIEITPFGVDVERFCKMEFTDKDDAFVIGNVKALMPVYGIDTLIRAYAIVKNQNPNRKTKLMIVGDGSHRNEYKQLAEKLGLAENVHFLGRVENQKLPELYNQFSVAVSLSQAESFGVVAVEAMACETTVITSDADGFTEVVVHEETGLIVPKSDERAAAEAIQKLMDYPEILEEMGGNGRKRVLELYNWEENVKKMCQIYKEIL